MCQHVAQNTQGTRIFVSNEFNNIDVYILPNTEITKTLKVYKNINIDKKGMTCSVAFKNKLIVGCKDGNVFEVDSESLTVLKNYQGKTPVMSVDVLYDITTVDLYVMSQKISSGYLEARS